MRLQRELMESAALVGARHQRSAAEQIEYWAALGRQVARVLDPDSLLDVAAEQVIRNAALPLGAAVNRRLASRNSRSGAEHGRSP
ncbi:ParD-like family protein [Cyanobium sp. Cruz CV13-4-11]|uniref:ParD-like family protein n=1 Tax=unclassified Cyanobium TaxID=2627006 RepID=UPI0020CBFD78|nr:ParD-like family protein [Cyanobium sp. Cruz CV13-4-11]